MGTLEFLLFWYIIMNTIYKLYDWKMELEYIDRDIYLKRAITVCIILSIGFIIFFVLKVGYG